MPPTLDVALHAAEQAEREFSDQPSLKGDDCQDQSGPTKHCCRRCGARVDAAGAALSRGKNDSGFPVGAGRRTGPETQSTGPRAGAVSAGQ